MGIRATEELEVGEEIRLENVRAIKANDQQYARQRREDQQVLIENWTMTEQQQIQVMTIDEREKDQSFERGGLFVLDGWLDYERSFQGRDQHIDGQAEVVKKTDKGIEKEGFEEILTKVFNNEKYLEKLTGLDELYSEIEKWVDGVCVWPTADSIRIRIKKKEKAEHWSRTEEQRIVDLKINNNNNNKKKINKRKNNNNNNKKKQKKEKEKQRQNSNNIKEQQQPIILRP
ncbi:hypothetical protein BY996DRAFT_6579229 [Phakopsora pachyrhizi]|nr:hypothetical protein BY996DRAFT_6579229 [Phakopsora pachyrhizi]